MKTISFVHSVKAAVRGMIYTFGRERNYRFEVISSIIVLGALPLLQASRMDYVICLFSICIVLCAELANTALERVVDILKPNKHPYARVIKDISAAMVLTSALVASIFGFIVFIPLLRPLF